MVWVVLGVFISQMGIIQKEGAIDAVAQLIQPCIFFVAAFAEESEGNGVYQNTSSSPFN